MKKILSAVILALVVALVPAGAFAKPGGTEGRYGTGYFTVGPATLPASGCINHPMRADVNLDYATDGWFISVNALRPDGSLADGWVSEVYWYDYGASYFEETIMLCTGLDMPGTYTMTGTIHTVNNGSSTVVQQPMTPATFAVNPYVAPVVTPPPPPAPVTADVVGNVTKKFITRGVKLTFKAKKLPDGTVLGRKLRWSIVVDNKVKSFSQGPDSKKVKSLTFPRRSGVHKIKVLRNGKVAMRLRVRA